jgi:hypothetical protein
VGNAGGGEAGFFLAPAAAVPEPDSVAEGAEVFGGAGSRWFTGAGFAAEPDGVVPEPEGVAAAGADWFVMRCPGTISSAGRTEDGEYLSG